MGRSNSPPPGISFPVFVPSSAKLPAGAPGAQADDRAQADAATRRDADADADADADEPAEPRPGGRSIRAILLVAVLVIGAAGAGVFALLGYLNSDRYVLACEPDRAVPEQGRSFPPWGTHALTGAAWRPVKIAPETRCQSRETDDELVLQRVFLAMVLDQATALLAAHDTGRVDDAEALLQQALLLTRPAEHEAEALAHQRGEQHQEIERLLGDVAYWRGQAKVRDALSALGDAARQFDSAAARHPRHVSDAAAWAARVRSLSDDLRPGSADAAGPAPTSAAPPISTSPSASSAPPISTSPSASSAPPTSTSPSASSAPPTSTSPSASSAPPISTSPSASSAPPASAAPPASSSPPVTVPAATGSSAPPAAPGELERSPRPPQPPAPPAGGVLI